MSQQGSASLNSSNDQNFHLTWQILISAFGSLKEIQEERYGISYEEILEAVLDASQIHVARMNSHGFITSCAALIYEGLTVPIMSSYDQPTLGLRDEYLEDNKVLYERVQQLFPKYFLS